MISSACGSDERHVSRRVGVGAPHDLHLAAPAWPSKAPVPLILTLLWIIVVSVMVFRAEHVGECDAAALE